MNVNPGEIDKKIKIVKFEQEKNKEGFPSKKIETVVRDTWAKVTRTSIRDAMNAERKIILTRSRFLVRYSPKKITHEMFILYNGVYYKIEYVNNYNDSDEYIEIMATAGEV